MSIFPHEHGGEVYALARRMRIAPDTLLDFSSNANVFARDITRHLINSAGAGYPFEYYPDTRADALVEAISHHEQIERDRILPGNGSAELIWLAIQTLAPRKALFIGPIFSEYVRACQAFDIPYDIITPSPKNDFTCTTKEMTRLWKSDADLVVLCTPNNPAGITYANIHSLLHMLRAPRVLIDNSYREFLYGTEDYETNHLRTYCKSIRPGVSLFTLHSFTKFFCCPGIRLGYLMGDRNQLARMSALRPSWTISPFAQIMGITLLDYINDYRATLPSLYEAVAHMGRELRRIACIDAGQVFEGPGFLCCALSVRHNASAVCSAFLLQRLLARNCDSIPGMPAGFLRLRARPENDCAQLLAALGSL